MVPRIREKPVRTKRKRKVIYSLSMVLIGLKSPKPTLDKVVKV